MLELLDDHRLLNNVQQYTYASISSRISAFILDAVITLIPIAILNVCNLVWLNKIIIAYLCALIYPFYKIYMEGTFGYTLGKKWMKIKVIQEDAKIQDMRIKTAIVRYSCLFPYLLGQLLLIHYTYSLTPMDFNNPQELIDAKIQYPTFVKQLKQYGGLFLLFSLAFAFVGNKKQALHDRFAGTVCIKM